MRWTIKGSELKQTTAEFRVNSNLCVGCGLCAEACPSGAISLRSGVARIDQGKCNGCGLCADVCPRRAIIERLPVTKNELEITIASLKLQVNELARRIENLRK
jgi:ferredoxin